MRSLQALFFAAAFALAVPLCGQVDLATERKAMVRGDVHGVIRRLSAALAQDVYRSDLLEKARILELLG